VRLFSGWLTYGKTIEPVLIIENPEPPPDVMPVCLEINLKNGIYFHEIG
jgi:hypothetical protein